MSLSPTDWHLRFQEQAGWTASLRAYLFEQVRIDLARRVLEVGCGTGAILGTLESATRASIFGIDISYTSLNYARNSTLNSTLICADGYILPFPDHCFDITLAHFLLLWVQDPISVVKEMVRVTQPGGSILLLAEPDYGGRLDYPIDLAQLGKWQIQALQHQGANPFIGRQLTTILKKCGLTIAKAGVLGGQWAEEQNVHSNRSLEWEVILSDLASLPSPPSADEVTRLRILDQSAREQGRRVLFTPTFYAWGQIS